MFDNEVFSGIFQMEIFRQFRTGNPLIDAVLFSILTFFVSRVIQSSLTQYFKNILLLFRRDGVIRYRIDRQQPVETSVEYKEIIMERNPLYYALAWYLRKAHCTKGHAKSYRVIINSYEDNISYYQVSYLSSDSIFKQKECILIPTSDITILYDNISMNGEYEHEDDEKGQEIKDGFIITVKDEHVEKMNEFFEVILAQHLKHVDFMNQGQKIFSLSTNGYGDKDLIWLACVFSSCTVLSNIILKDNKQLILKRDIETFLQSLDLYRKHGKLWKRGYLFYGPPGTGKTSLVKGIATITKYSVYNVKLSRFRTDESMETLLRRIPSKSIVLFEDIDCMSKIAHKRSNEDNDRDNNVIEPQVNVQKSTDDVDSPIKVEMTNVDEKKPTLSTLLNFIDGISSPDGIIVIMTTNHIEKLDSALLRDGRIDFRLYLGFCDRQQILDFINNFFDVKMDISHIQNIPDNRLSPATVSRIMLDIAFKKTTGDLVGIDRIKTDILFELGQAMLENDEMKNKIATPV